MQARAATPGDAAAIARIYNAGIEERVATFETRPCSAEEIRSRLEGPYPVVVVEDGGEVVAFAWTSPYSDRGCYAGIADFSVYVDRRFRGRGAGRLAVGALVSAAEERGFWRLTSKVFVENAPSRRLLFSLSFREVGVHEKHARLDGAWRDVAVVERLLSAQPAATPRSGPRAASSYSPSAARTR